MFGFFWFGSGWVIIGLYRLVKVGLRRFLGVLVMSGGEFWGAFLVTDLR